MVRELIQWNSVGGQLIDAFNREMEGLADKLQHPEGWNEDVATFSPRTDVVETDKSFELFLEMPGMSADGFDIEFHEGRLMICGERTRPVVEEGRTFRRSERQYGAFRRIFALGTDIDSDNVSASYENGLLTVNVPKTAEAQPKKIKVS